MRDVLSEPLYVPFGVKKVVDDHGRRTRVTTGKPDTVRAR